MTSQTSRMTGRLKANKSYNIVLSTAIQMEPNRTLIELNRKFPAKDKIRILRDKVANSCNFKDKVLLAPSAATTKKIEAGTVTDSIACVELLLISSCKLRASRKSISWSIKLFQLSAECAREH